MGKIKGWTKILKTPSALSEGGDKFHGIWKNNGHYVFIVDDNFSAYIIGEKYASQMDEPNILARANNLEKAINYITRYMKSHPNG